MKISAFLRFDLINESYFSPFGFECALIICLFVRSGLSNSNPQILHLFVNTVSFLKIFFIPSFPNEKLDSIQIKSIVHYKALLNIVNWQGISLIVKVVIFQIKAWQILKNIVIESILLKILF